MPLVPPSSTRARQLALTLPPLVWHLVSGRPVRFGRLAETATAGFTPAPKIYGAEFIPPVSPFIVVLNHYESSRSAAWWGPLILNGVIEHARTAGPRTVRWVLAREWWYPRGIGRAIKQPATRLFLARAAQVFDFVVVPPILTGDLTRGEGVEGVRHALALTRGPLPQIVGIAPEGRGGPGGTLAVPPQGAGIFLSLLSHGAVPFLPVGWYDEEDRTITAHFGPPFMLKDVPPADRHKRDCAAAAQVMIEIGHLLPERLWGVYHDQIASRVQAGE